MIGKTLKVAPTDEDCERSNPGRPMSCAVSTAVRRMFPAASFVCTKHNCLTVTINGRYLHFALSNKGSRAIDDFDARGTKPPPLSFTLFDVRPITQISDTRKQQINAARQKRVAEGRPDKTYRSDPLRMRTTKLAKAAPRASS
jgi:hypothetical protein